MIQKKHNQSQKPYVWTIAASDSSAGAGIQADLKTFLDLGVQGASVVTAITAQNSLGVSAYCAVTETIFKEQIAALKQDNMPVVIKLGVLPQSQESVDYLVRYLEHYPGYVIWDPVLQSSSGYDFFSKTIDKIYWRRLLARTDLVTPNLSESTVWLGRKTAIDTAPAMQEAAYSFLKQGARSVLVKGGHLDGRDAMDYWQGYDKKGFWLRSNKVSTVHTHGTGCVLSSAIAAFLALGYNLPESLLCAKHYVTQGLRASRSYGPGIGAVAHTGKPQGQQDFPAVYSSYSAVRRPFCAFKPLEKIGFYPIVQSVEQIVVIGFWCRIYQYPLRCVQLRIKNKIGKALTVLIQEAVRVAHFYNFVLIINDHWKEAIQCKADGVHLGQEDLVSADIEAIAQTNLYLGVSTHNFFEIAQVSHYRPSYIACGPVFSTKTKVLAYPLLTLSKIPHLYSILADKMVVIGGIQQENLAQLLSTPAENFAMISGVQTGIQVRSVLQFLQEWRVGGHRQALYD